MFHLAIFLRLGFASNTTNACGRIPDMASLQTAALHGAKYARDNCDNSTLQISDVGTVRCQWSGFEPLRIWCIWCIDWVDGLSWRFLMVMSLDEKNWITKSCLNEQHCAVHITLLHNGFEPKWVCCLSSSVDFLFRPAPPLRPCCQLLGQCPKRMGVNYMVNCIACPGMLAFPWISPLNMSTKNIKKTKHLVVSSKKASLHHPIQSDAGHYQIWGDPQVWSTSRLVSEWPHMAPSRRA